MRPVYTIWLMFLLPCINIYAQEDSQIQTDRPSETESTSTVPAGHFQLEAGFVHRQHTEGEREFTLPTVLWKYGVNDHLELRVITDIRHNNIGDSITSGLEPVKVGLKVNLWEEKGAIPETSLLMHLQVPKLASRELTASYLAPELILAMSNTITDKINLGYNIGSLWDGESPEPAFEYTFAPNFKLTEKLAAFVESFGYLPQHHHAEHWVDGGLLFIVDNNVQIDISGGYELTAHNHYHRFFESVGVSFRI